MQIVTDTGMDLVLPEHMIPDFELNVIRHNIALNGNSYRSGEDIASSKLYEILETTGAFPTTSQPTANEFAEKYRALAVTDPDILSIHMSSGLSGVVNAAKAGAQMVPEANVTIYDTKTLSVSYGWHVAMAVRAIKAGLPLDQIIAALDVLGQQINTMYTLSDLRYLIHGGRISHMKGLLASALNLKPIIGVEKTYGKYEQLGVSRTFKKAIRDLVGIMQRTHKPGTELLVQVGNAANPEGSAILQEEINQTFQCKWLPEAILSPVLGAHTGPSMIGMAFASLKSLEALP